MKNSILKKSMAVLMTMAMVLSFVPSVILVAQAANVDLSAFPQINNSGSEFESKSNGDMTLTVYKRIADGNGPYADYSIERGDLCIGDAEDDLGAEYATFEKSNGTTFSATSISIYIFNQAGIPGIINLYGLDASGKQIGNGFTTGNISKGALQTIDLAADGDFTSISKLKIVDSGTNYCVKTLDVIAAVSYKAPTLTATGGTMAFTENGSAVDLFSSVNAETNDTDQTFSGLTLTVSNVTDTKEYLSIGGTDVELINGKSGTISGIGSYSVTVASNTATVTVSGMTLSDAQMKTLIEGITYRNTSENPSTASSRAIKITNIVDSGSSSNSASLNITATVSVTAVNDAPTDIGLSATSVNENVAGNTTVGTLSSTDPDASNSFTYSIVSVDGDTTSAAFNIDGNNLRITNSPDFETKNSYLVRIRTTDQGSLSYEKAVTVTINNQNEAPTDIALSSCSVNENVTGNTTVGALSTTDPDESNSFTYSIVSVDGDTTSTAFNIAGNDLRITNSPDFEAKNSYSVRIRTTDQGSLSYEKVFTITINNINDAPTVSGLPTNINVLEDTQSNLNLSAATFNDDEGDSLAVTLTASAGTFAASSSGSVTVGGNGTKTLTLAGTAANVNAFLDIASNINYTGALNASGASAATITVNASDGTGNPMLGTINLNITDVNDAPTLTATFSNPTFTEDGSAVSLFSGTTVSTIESGQTITTLMLTVDNLLDDASEMLNIDGTVISGASGSTATNGMSYAASISSGTATITLTKVGGISTAAMQTLINGITYSNSNENPTAGNRVVTLTSIQDNGGTANGGVDKTVLSVASAVAVVSVNDAPSFTKGSDVTLLEDCGAQSVTGWATSLSAGSSQESGQTLSFTASNDNNALFSVQPAVDPSGTLTFTPAANANGTATVTVSIHDNGGTENGGVDVSASQTFMITVTSVNDAPSFTKGIDITVLEDCGVQSISGWATAVSAGPSDESGQVLSFTASNNNNALFSIQPAVAPNGTLTFTPAVNANGTATVTVSVHDNGGTANGGVDASASQTFTITITSVNDAPTVINSTKTLDEDTTLTFAAADFTGNYSDATENSELSTVRIETLPDAGNGKLQLSGVDITANQVVNAADLENITFVPALNFSGNATFTWKASDGTDYSASSATMTLRVNAVNDAPTDIGLSATSVNENVAGNTTVGTLSSTDPDASNTFTYSIVSVDGDTTSAAFNIDGNNLRITNSPDYEAKNSYSVRIRTTDQGGLTYEKAVTITINNQNEAPTDIALSSSSVNENVTGNTTVGTLSSTDPDASNTFTYSIVSVDGETTSNAFNIDGDNLRITNSPDFETKNSYSVRVLTTDQNGLTFEKAFTITINDQNDAPLITSGAPSPFAENGVGVVYVATGTDPEHGSITWSISGTDAGLFNIDNSTGALSFKTAPNFESPADSGANNVYDLTITATDNGTGNRTATKTISITVTNVNESPIISTNGAISITEGSTTAFTAAGSDPEGSALSWSITGGADQAKFSIVSGTGEVAFKTAPSFSAPSDADAHNDYVLELTASDGTSTAVKAVTVTVTQRPSGGGGSGSSGTSTSTNVVVEVNGQKQDAGAVKTQTTAGQTVTTITVDDTKLNKVLESKGEKPTVTLPANTTSGVVVGELSGQTVKNMEKKEAVLEIKTGTVSYTLPASQINIDAVSSQLGSQVELKDIKVSVKIAEPSADTAKIVEDTAKKGSYQIVVKPVEFEISCTSGGKSVSVSKFNGYVERTFAIPDGVDPSKITTGIVLNSDGTFRHVPTTIVKIDGKYFAKVNSLTNSTYSVIWNPVTFADVANHWAKDAVNDMGSRMVVTGVSKSTYEPDRSITRAEFAAIVVRALGLAQGTQESSFGDVSQNEWFNGYVDTATAYALITGYDSNSFAPNDTITREQAMAILARAMKTTGLKVSLTDAEVSTLLTKYEDGNGVSDYAKASVATCVKSGVVTGSSATTISPKAYVTRAEVAVMVQHLLQKSALI